MSNEQPLAERLAEELEALPMHLERDLECAAELRRLHEVEAERDALRAEVEVLRNAALPMEMALCERHSLVMRVGQPYVFRPIDGCESCDAALARAREAYGHDAGAPVHTLHTASLIAADGRSP